MQATPGEPWITQVETACAKRGLQMTSLRREIAGILAGADQPLGAYAIIQKLSDVQGRIVAPPTVYRTLDFLVENGFVVKIESRQAYLACDHVGHGHDHHGVLLSCVKCGRSSEIDSAAIDREIAMIAAGQSFRVERKVFEVDGVCADCAAPRPEPAGATTNGLSTAPADG